MLRILVGSFGILTVLALLGCAPALAQEVRPEESTCKEDLAVTTRAVHQLVDQVLPLERRVAVLQRQLAEVTRERDALRKQVESAAPPAKQE
jgi:phage shock protein A